MILLFNHKRLVSFYTLNFLEQILDGLYKERSCSVILVYILYKRCYRLTILQLASIYLFSKTIFMCNYITGYLKSDFWLCLRDGDSIPDAFDNCPSYMNGDQADTDNDGIGLFYLCAAYLMLHVLYFVTMVFC